MPTSFRAAAVAVLVLSSACGPRRLAVVAPIPDAEGTASELRDRTSLEDPLRIDFGWQLNEGGQRVQGRGVARVEPPYKARLDLFLHNGETVVSAALVEGDLRLPAGAPDDILPPPDLMWAVLGVFRPPEGTALLAAERLEGDATRLRYGYPDGAELHYELVDGSVRRLELLERGQVVQRVQLEPEPGDRYPAEAVYRNMADFRELTLERNSLRVVEAFDAAIWDPRS
jgi:hypothetical protein